MRRIPLILFALFLAFVQPAEGAPIGGEVPQKVGDRFLPEGDGVRVGVWIEDLEIPWSLLFLSDDRALVSERPGRIRLIRGGKLRGDPYATLNVAHVGEGGLMGLCLHPQFQKKPYLYAMITYRKGSDLFNRVVRLKDLGDHGEFDKVILDDIPGGRFHNGGRIGFGPDGLLYVTGGETFKAEIAQNLNSLGGKILRVTEEGGIPEGNPFKDSPIYSYGHRNPQGLSWHPESGDLFESEHGPSGESLRFAHDEVNVIVKGGNYGWPEVIGAAGRKPYVDPLIVWKKTTPPSGMTFYNGALLPRLKNDLFVATLKSESLIRIKVKKEGSGYVVAGIERWFAQDFKDGKYGRIRDVVVGPDGALYFLTNNRDGRGNPKKGDDKIYRITGK